MTESVAYAVKTLKKLHRGLTINKALECEVDQSVEMLEDEFGELDWPQVGGWTSAVSPAAVLRSYIRRRIVDSGVDGDDDHEALNALNELTESLRAFAAPVLAGERVLLRQEDVFRACRAIGGRS